MLEINSKLWPFTEAKKLLKMNVQVLETGDLFKKKLLNIFMIENYQHRI